MGSDFYSLEPINKFWTAKAQQSVAAPTGVMSASHAQDMQTADVSDASDDPKQENMGEETLRDCYGKVYLEAYGPHVHPLDYAAWDLDSPQDQRCVVCLEAHGFVSVKTSACGHYFRLACIKEWLNHTLPECQSLSGMPGQDLWGATEGPICGVDELE
ncbi:hypothetical protein G6011_09089 [Alternaria panax]|uniref:RING-type domain-containing protein n=1 Tax=Alternaria panax TaxID=48097 RepID=A0AAD4NM22_9PLEO|nr:hypothetical protein G6011_09089 [Alternaria panax]